VHAGSCGGPVELAAVGLEVAPHETVGQVKERLSEALGVSAARQRLIWRRVGLPNNRALAACGVPDGAELQVVLLDQTVKRGRPRVHEGPWHLGQPRRAWGGGGL